MSYARLCAGAFLTLVFFIGCATTTRGLNFGRPAGATEQARAYSHYLASVLLERQGNFSASLEQMEAVNELDPDAVAPTLRLVRAYLWRQDYERALLACERAVRQQPDSANLWIVLGEIYHKLDRTEDAVRAFSKAIEVNPENVLGYGALAELQETTNDLVAAVDIYRRLTELQPDQAPLHFQLGINLARINDGPAAAAAFERALELDPNLQRARYLLGVIYFEEDAFDQSIEAMEVFVASNQDNVDAREVLAASYAQRGKFATAFNYLMPVLASNRATPGHHLQAMYLHLRAGMAEQAEQLAPPSGAPHLGAFLRAVARRAKGEPTAPLVAAMDQIQGDLDAECNQYLNELLYLFGAPAGEYLDAEAAALQREATRSNTLTTIQARTHMSLEQYARAIPLLETLASRVPENKDIHYYRAVCYEELDDFDRTEAALRAYLAIDPADPDVLNFLGYLYAEHAVKLDEAEQLLVRALDADPDNPYYLDSLGWIYYQMGRTDEAIDLIQRAILGMDNDDAILRDHLGDAFFQRGDLSRALAEWERAYRLDPTLEGVKEKLDEHRP